MGSAALLIGSRMKAATPDCTLTAEQEVGPYYIDFEKVRQEITEGHPGLPLRLQIALVDSKSCAPLPSAALDIWHCDASGVYSGFTASSPDGPPPFRGRGGPSGPGGPPPMRQTDATRFLRGVQVTDKKGMVEFATLYPGWYSGRAIHIHMKVHLGGRDTNGTYSGGHVSHTGQLFFPEEITEQVAKMSPYVKRANVHRTTQAEDGIFNSQHGAASMVKLERLDEGFLATVTLAVDPEATPAPARPMRR